MLTNLDGLPINAYGNFAENSGINSARFQNTLRASKYIEGFSEIENWKSFNIPCLILILCRFTRPLSEICRALGQDAKTTSETFQRFYLDYAPPNLDPSVWRVSDDGVTNDDFSEGETNSLSDASTSACFCSAAWEMYGFHWLTYPIQTNLLALMTRDILRDILTRADVVPALPGQLALQVKLRETGMFIH